MSETPPRPETDGAPAQPFTRGRIQWSRPPQPVFQVGPLPRAQTSAFVTPPAPRRSGPGILTGSMIPPARPAAAEATPEGVAAPEIDPVFEPVATEPETLVAPEPDPVVADAPVEIIVEPEAPPQESQPRRRPREILVEIEEAEPAVTLTPPLSGEAPPAAEPRSMPSVVVTPAIYASVSAAIETVTKKDRWMIVAAVAAVVVIGGFIWLATLPAGGAVDLDAPPPPAQGLTVEVVDPPAAATVAAPARATTAAPARTTTAPRSATARRAPAPATEAAAPPANAPQPSIETAPLAVEPPVPAEPAPTDPDAPIPTQPQPLN